MADADSNGAEDLKKLEELVSGEVPSTKQLLEMLEEADVSDEMKENLRSMLTGNSPQVFGGHGGGTLLALVFVFIIFAIICKSMREVGKMAEEPETKLNLVNLIREKVIEQFKTVDVVTLIKNVIAATPEDEDDGVRENLLKVLDQYNSMSDEDKQFFANKMRNTLADKISMKIQDSDGAVNLDGLQEAISQAIMYRFMIVAAFVVIFFILLVFFGYKLYKSIKEKEIKREEKKKAKELKKKK